MVSSKDKSLTPNNGSLKLNGLKLNDRYKMVGQNNAINAMFRINDKRNTVERQFDKEIKADSLTAITQKIHLGSAEAQLLAYINSKFFETPNHDNIRRFSFTLKEYMHDSDKKDPKTTRKALKKKLDTIAGTTYAYNSSKSSKNNHSVYDVSFGRMPLLGYSYVHGTVYIELTDFFHDFLVNHTMPMPFPKLTFKLDPQKEKVALYISWAIVANKRINKASARGNRMSVKTLLSKIPSLPTYDEVMSSNRHVYDRIIEPVLKGIERLANPVDGIITRYSFTGKDGKLLDYKSLDYTTFINADLVIEKWNEYPEEYLERWNKTQKGIKHRKKKNKSKNQSDKHHV